MFVSYYYIHITHLWMGLGKYSHSLGVYPSGMALSSVLPATMLVRRMARPVGMAPSMK